MADVQLALALATQILNNYILNMETSLQWRNVMTVDIPLVFLN